MGDELNNLTTSFSVLEQLLRNINYDGLLM
jgi:hypothetical protein